jgi:hypothetical protein
LCNNCNCCMSLLGCCWHSNSSAVSSTDWQIHQQGHRVQQGFADAKGLQQLLWRSQTLKKPHLLRLKLLVSIF